MNPKAGQPEMPASTPSLLPDMGEYAAYIWASYGLASVIMAVLFLASANALRQAKHKLNRLQSGLQPANEQATKDK